MLGQHCIRTWSSTQPSVTLSSGEAEFYGLVKAAGAGLGHQSLLRDMGLEILRVDGLQCRHRDHDEIRPWQAAPSRDALSMGTRES